MFRGKFSYHRLTQLRKAFASCVDNISQFPEGFARRHHALPPDRLLDCRQSVLSLYSRPFSPWNSKYELIHLLRRVVQHRSMFVETRSTPNPSSLMFMPNRSVLEEGSADFPNARSASSSPLAKVLFRIEGVSGVFLGSDFVTVTKSNDLSWAAIKPEIFAALMDFFATGQPVVNMSEDVSSTAVDEDDDEIVAMIKELLETRIRPAVQDDGGDIEFRSFDFDSGVVTLKMQGACSGCPSSSLTLKSGIENMLMHYVPEVKAVVEAKDADAEDMEETPADRAALQREWGRL